MPREREPPMKSPLFFKKIARPAMLFLLSFTMIVTQSPVAYAQTPTPQTIAGSEDDGASTDPDAPMVESIEAPVDEWFPEPDGLDLVAVEDAVEEEDMTADETPADDSGMLAEGEAAAEDNGVLEAVASAEGDGVSEDESLSGDGEAPVDESTEVPTIIVDDPAPAAAGEATSDYFLPQSLRDRIPDKIEEQLIEALRALAPLRDIDYVPAISHATCPGFTCGDYSQLAVWILQSMGMTAELFNLPITDSLIGHAQVFLQIVEEGDPNRLHRFVIEPQNGLVQHYWVDESAGTLDEREEDLKAGLFDAVEIYNGGSYEGSTATMGLDTEEHIGGHDFFGDDGGLFADYADYIGVETDGKLELSKVLPDDPPTLAERTADIYDVPEEDVAFLYPVEFNVPEDTLTPTSAVLEMTGPEGDRIKYVSVTVYNGEPGAPETSYIFYKVLSETTKLSSP